ncbi:MAG: oxidase [Planctomycetaceae bacterium]|nr:oxidase [Planctomycetaceae bacterium]
MSDPAAHAPAADSAPHDEHPHVNYWLVFLALCILTAASVVADMVRGKMGIMLLVLIVLTVATFKAMFVMMYFMHLKFEGKWKYVLLAPTMILALAIPAALMPDIGSHYYDVQVPQTKAAPAHDGEAGHEAPKPKH